MGTHIHMKIFYGVCISRMDASDDEPIPQLDGDRYSEMDTAISNHPDFEMITTGYFVEGYTDDYLAIAESVVSLYEAFHLDIDVESIEGDRPVWDKLLSKFCQDNRLPISDGKWIVGVSYG